jgi:hypothetical protein
MAAAEGGRSRPEVHIATRLLLSLAVLGAACHGPRNPAPASRSSEDDTTRLKELSQAVAQQVGSPTCTDRSQCRVMPLGAKPCGGPSSYVVYSTTTADSVRLAVAVQEYTAYQAALNEKLGLVSDCRFLPPPAVDCRTGVCASSGETQ